MAYQLAEDTKIKNGVNRVLLATDGDFNVGITDPAALESFVVGEHFTANDPILTRRRFLDRAQKILLDLYPLWLFATSKDVRNDYELYNENIQSLARPVARAAAG